MNDVGQILKTHKELECIYQGLEEVYKIFMEDSDYTNSRAQSASYMIDNFKMTMIRVAYAALELRLLYCPTDVIIDPFYSIILKFPDERINIAFDMNGNTAIYLVVGASLMDATVKTYTVNSYDELKTKLSMCRADMELR